MALFKIFRGPSERLKGIKPTEGYAYFTPDDGKFYIDIANSEEAIVGNSSMVGANRICINSGLKDILVLNCGTATTVINEGTTIPSEPTLVPHFTCGDSSSTITS